MERPSSQQEQVNSDPRFKVFWDQFRLFKWKRWDEFGFNHWYLIGIFYLFFLTLDLLYDIHLQMIFPQLNLASFRHDLTDLVFILFALWLVAAVLLFNLWRRSIKTTLQLLFSKGRLRSKNETGDVSSDYLLFLKEYQHALWSKKRFIVVVVIMIIGLMFLLAKDIPYFAPSYISDPLVWIFNHVLGLDYSPPCYNCVNVNNGIYSDDYLATLRWLFGIVGIMLPIFLVSYFSGIAAWSMAITGFYIAKSPSSFQLNIQPNHPDEAGGLKLLGTLCINTALPIITGILIFGLYGIGILLIPNLKPLTMESGFFSLDRFMLIFANLILFVILVPLAFFAFVLPLWSIHSAMVVEKEAYDSDYEAHVVLLEEKIRSLLDREALQQAKDAKEELETRQVVYPDKKGYPVWPLDHRILLALSSIQIGSIVTTLLSWLLKGM